MTSFDETIIRFLNSFSNRSHAFDTLMQAFCFTHLLKGVPIIALLWWAWFWSTSDLNKNRQTILATLLGTFCAMFSARGLALLLPFRFRPIHNPDFAFQTPSGFYRLTMEGWSAFPSDHAALFFALTTGLWMVSWRLGLLALLQTVFVVSFPRVYVGLHHPTDIIAGAMISILFVGMANTTKVRSLIARPGLFWLERNAPSFYTFAFLLTEQMATVFEDTRFVATQAYLFMKKFF